MDVAATLMRGGTSKCWVFRGADVPQDRDELGRFLAAAYGARDPFELDGVGGGTSVTSKALVMYPSEHGCDADYLFAQVAIGTGEVEWASNCGNCATAAALWTAEDMGADADQAPVRLFNLNTGAQLEAVVAHRGGREELDTTVPGVIGEGVAVELAFVNPEGSNTGMLWPTGNASDELTAAGGTYAVSMVDAGAPVALVDATQWGTPGVATIAEFDADVARLRELRRAAALAMGLSRPSDPVADSVPKIGTAAAPADYVTTTGQLVRADEYDVSVRMLSMLATHPAIGLTSAVAITLMSQDPASVVGRLLPGGPRSELTIGTPGGLVRTRLQRDDSGTKIYLQRAARRMADAVLHVPDTMGVNAR